ncbi:MAG: hypothetical protein Q4G68_08230 [Planctomycetia bacterium]|nr:hypothetical protein [Planctomycetia bacterium]
MKLYSKNMGLMACLVVVFLFASSVQGQEPFEELVDSDTIAVSRINVEQVDMGKFIQSVSTLASAIVDMSVENEQDRQQAKQTLPVIVGMMVSPYASVFETLRANGVDSVYIIGNTKDAEVSDSYFAIPLSNQTDEQKKALRDLAKGDSLSALNIRFPFVRHGFLFAPIVKQGISDDDVKNYIKANFKELNPVANPIFSQGLSDYPDVALCIVSAVKTSEVSEEEISESLANLDLSSVPGGAALAGEDMDEHKDTIARFAKEFANNVTAVVQGITVNELSWSLKLRLKSAAALESVKKNLVGAAEEVITQTKKQQNAESAPLTEDLMTALTPVYGTDTVTWTIDKTFWTQNEALLRDIFKKVAAANAPASEEGTDDTSDSDDMEFDEM